MENFYDFLKVVGTAIGLVLSYIGGAKLLEIYVSWRIKKKETDDQIHATNQAKQIDDLAAFRNELRQEVRDLKTELKERDEKHRQELEKRAKESADELKKRDAKIDQIQEKVNGFIESNAHLKAANESLKEANTQLQTTVNEYGQRVEIYKTAADETKLELSKVKLHVKNLEGILRMHKIEFPEMN